MTLSSGPSFLTIAATAKRWAISARTVRRLISRGELAVVRIGKSLRVPLEEIRRYERNIRF